MTEQSNGVVGAAIFWLFWRLFLYLPFFVNFHFMIYFGVIPPMPFYSRFFVCLLPFYIYAFLIEISIRFLKRNEIALANYLSRGTLGATLGVVVAMVLNSIVINSFEVNVQFYTFLGIIFAPLGIHIQNVLRVAFLVK